ncbi:hypothetical protein TVAG_251250 [Trichomonas vaginalis G3]|uniref:BAR domain-containing protein n=1 Tax=Trichomonas vaginalis (strain ATCC PRA-98 / G3) TaxID=412133 RepID=A2FUZ0_TRIV3|nr:BAR/IMD domain-like family [Trichomonas vaginalis G3]EAX91281.1 hypothetical protein TVAG_251250 [Trichomonas vaginalis G3]KAI5538449.1 BAR/IMD domain-like family [Trichomonas vaginalis G3]|eukprot:XP_001304211.1 hypothetical protein [Trichomonas vaginalis G3]
MKNFLNKAKVQMKLAAHSVQETTGHSKIEEDPETKKIWQRVEAQNKNLDELITNVQKLKRTYYEFATYQHSAHGNLFQLYTNESPKYNEVSACFQSSEAVFNNAKAFNDEYAKQQIENLALALKTELHKVRIAFDARKKDYILLEDAKKSLAKAQTKGKDKKVADKQKEVDQYSASYQTQQQEFMNVANAYFADCQQKIDQIFEVYQFYICELTSEQHKAIIEKPAYNWEASKGKYPSVTVPPAAPAQ